MPESGADLVDQISAALSLTKRRIDKHEDLDATLKVGRTCARSR
ncbi:MAG: hypothetical protein RIS43_266 [Actinomycetota bacterium]